MLFNDLYLRARRELQGAGVGSAALEARELCAFACGVSREDFLKLLGTGAPAESREKLEVLLERRLLGEPLAYILGEWDFYGLTFALNKYTLVPRADTETVVDAALEILKGRKGPFKILDLCSGSGCIGLSVLKNHPETILTMAELSEGALEISKENAAKLGLSRRVSARLADALSLPPKELRGFDLILSNPPYIPKGELDGLDGQVRRYEPLAALDGGEDGLIFYRAIAGLWKEALTPGGSLVLECGMGQAGQVLEILDINGFEPLETIKDLSGIDRVVSGALSRG